MKAKCKKCGDTVEVTKPKEFKSCKCGAINLDYGDEYYYRVGGNPKDFDGEIEDVPKINDDLVYRPKTIKIDNFWAEMAEHFKAMAKLCEEKSESR